MRRLALLLLIALIPARAWAFSSDDLLATIAMPLAVAAVSDVNGVPSDGLSDLVVALNEANVPPTRFVEVIRYVPVVFVDQNGQPFVQYVREQTVQGVRGDALATSLVDRLQTRYDVTPALAFNGPATTYVVQDDYIPQTVVTRMSTVSYNSDPLSYIAMPLAVAAISNITGVPTDELANLVAALNQANMPPVQMVEVLRYAPAALVIDNGQPFVQYVQLQTSRGIVGTALVPVLVDELRTYYPPQTQITVSAPAYQPTYVTAFNDQDYVPPVVTTRVEEFRTHPHGGPPGQLKKQLGYQTGAEVVHGSKPGKAYRPAPAQPVAVVHEKTHGKQKLAPRPMISSSPEPERVRQPKPVKVKKQSNGKGHAQAPPVYVPRAASPAPAMAPAPRMNPPGKSKGHEAGGGPPGNPGKGKGGGGGKHGKG